MRRGLRRPNSLVAYYVAEGPAESTDELRRYLSGYLPPHMIPHGFVRVNEMPLTGGKIDRRVLPPWIPIEGSEYSMVPATATEMRLAALWQEAIGVRSSDASANFFDLGGDGLRATRLITLIHREFGRVVPLATLFQRPTIAGLAAVLEGDARQHRHAVIAFQSNGCRQPLFCVSATETDPHRFRNLSEQLNDQPFFAIPLPVNGGESVTVEDLAKRVCQAVVRVRPQGPWVLGGYCFGGVVAFEAARQLISDGGDVRLVALFDTRTPGYPKLSRAKRRYWQQIIERKVRVYELLAHASALRQLVARNFLGHLMRAGATISCPRETRW